MKNNKPPMFITCRHCGGSKDYNGTIPVDGNGDYHGSINCGRCNGKLQVKIKHYALQQVVKDEG